MPGKPVTDQQVQRYMHYRKQHTQAIAAAKAGMSERTARKFEDDPRLPSQRQAPRSWRTRADPLAGLWEASVVPMLEANPGLRAVTLFEELQATFGVERAPDGIRRTLERRVRAWRARHGPDQEVFFPQDHPPGRMGLSDFTDASELGVTIAGQPLLHRLYHFRLACSGWEHAEVVLGGESFSALAEGLQNALWRLGGVPGEHRTDSLSAAFRNLGAEQCADLTGRYDALCRHYGMSPSRNNPGVAHENGSIEAAHGHLKRRLDQALTRRGSRDFTRLADYRRFVALVVERHNSRRRTQVMAEAAVLRPLPSRRTTDFTELTVTVTRNATITVDKVLYSVPSRLIGYRLKVHLYDDRLQTFLGSEPILELPRVRPLGSRRPQVIDYRHVITSLRRKPQALRHLAYREALFPRAEYRRAWQAIDQALPEAPACRLMVGLLDLAARGACEAALARCLDRLLDAGELPDLAVLAAELAPVTPVAIGVRVDPPDLAAYDILLGRPTCLESRP